MKTKTSNFCLTLLMVFVLCGACSSSPLPKPNNSNSNANSNTSIPAIPEAGSAESKTAPPEMLVADLYKQHDAKKSPFFQTKNRALVDKYFTKALADLIWKDATESKNEVGAIDGDPLYNAQDTEIKKFAIGKGVINGQSATVVVTFTNIGEKQTLTHSLKLINKAWKIDNISYGSGDSLMKWLKDTYPDKPKA